MAAQAVRAVETLTAAGVDVELIDLRTLKPWDRETVFGSVRKTGRLVIADAAWKTTGAAAEIAAAVAEELFEALRRPVIRVCLPDTPAPMSAPLEQAYYLGADDIVAGVRRLLAH
jgi:pyruvate/2-oxoglutarate/acetoin dehydrogenase E1 component